MRYLYNALTYLMLIPFACYWLSRGIGNRSYFDRLGQRFGFGYPTLGDSIWVHAVSVGEVQAAAPLIKTLLDRYPDRPMLVTTVTPTGAARVNALFGDRVRHSFIPFEFPHAVRNFFDAAKPSAAMIVETEIWPNLYRGCGIRSIPLILVSARVSPRSIPGYRRMLSLIRETLSHGIIIAAQSDADAERFLQLGAHPDRTTVTGNIKFDVEMDPELPARGRALRESLFPGRPAWIAASTHEGEEELILAAHRRLREKHSDLLLVLVPRHPERFAVVRELCEKQDFKTIARSDDRPCDDETEVFLVDTMGDVPLFYAASDVAFVGGSLVPIGGHNLLEPAAAELPIITGPHTFNSEDIADKFVELEACVVVSTADELAAALARLFEVPQEAEKLGRNARTVLEQNRGALHRLLVLLAPLLDERAGS